MISTRRVRLGALLLGIFLALSPWRGPSGSDGLAMLATAESLLYRHTLAIDDRFATDNEYAPSAKRGPDGQAYSKYGIGLPLVQVPLIAVADAFARALGAPTAEPRALILAALNPMLAMLTCLLAMTLASELGASRWQATLLTVAAGASTLLLVHATSDGSDVLGTLAVTAAVAALARYERTRGVPAAWVCGAALAAAVLSRVLLVVVVPAFVAALAWTHVAREGPPRSLRGFVTADLIGGTLPITLPVVLAVALTLWLNTAQFGAPWQTGYNAPVMTGDVLPALFGLTVGLNKGLLWFAPTAFLGLVTGWRLLRSRPAVVLATAGGTVLLLLATARFYDWGGGWAWGPRYLLPVVPALVCACVPLFESSVGRASVTLSCLVGLAVSSAGAIVDPETYRGTLWDVRMPEVSGTVRAGDTLQPGVLVEIPIRTEDVVASFSEILGHAWLFRVAAAPCNCSGETRNCGCRTGEMENDPTFLSPPWHTRFPRARPTVPRGASLLRPALADWLYRRYVFDVDAAPRSRVQTVVEDATVDASVATPARVARFDQR